MRVVAIPEVQLYFEELAYILYEKEYFGFEDSAHRYSDELYEEIAASLPFCAHKPAPKHFDRYGENMEYAVFKKSKHTSWYVFFRVYWQNGEEVFYVRHITNIHVAAHLM